MCAIVPPHASYKEDNPLSIPESKMSFSVSDKVAVVTGGGTGIGRGIALELAKNGADVAIGGRRPGPLEEVAKEIRDLGQRSIAVPTDVTRRSEIENLAATVKSELGDVDILVNNAANGGTGPSLLDSDEERWDEIVDTNLKSVYLSCRAFAPSMIERKRGNIVNISSVASLRAPEGCRIYGIAKIGVNFLTQGLARDLAPHGIRVNCIAPGAVDTEMLAGELGNEEAHYEALKGMIPLGRVAQPIDIATAVLFLASDAANYITAQTLTIDAGLYV